LKSFAMQHSFEVVVTRRVQEAERIVAVELASIDGQVLPAWTAGAHIDVQTLDHSGRSVQRQYSLCGEPNDATWRIAVLDAPDARGGARWLHAVATPGEHLRVSAPRNNFRLHEGAEPSILVAGGIGITPILAMARALHARGAAFMLHYYARDAATAAFLPTLLASPFVAQTVVSLDSMPDAQRHPLARIFEGAPAASRVYLCGPTGFMEAVMQEARAHGVSADRIHREQFESAEADTGTDDRPFDLLIRSTGQVVPVARGVTAVAALAQAGIDIVVSCEQGLCGSCVTRIVDGTPEHRDAFMLPEEHARNDCFTPCCSRALSARLVLDL
jgi:vanillate O-demethylase ferredoxin subunit